MDYRYQTTLLAVDDENAILDCFTNYFEQFDYRVITANNPDDALGVLRNTREKIVLVTDLQMQTGAFAGKELLEQIMHEKLPVYCAILMSSEISDNEILFPDIASLFTAQMIPYRELSKPFRYPALKTLV